MAKKGKQKDKTIAAIKAEYITGEIRLRALSEKYQISEGKLFRYSSKESWRKKREEYRSKVFAEAIASAQTRAIDDVSDVLKMSKTLAGEVMLALGDPKQLYRRLVTDKNGNLIERDDFKKIDTGAVKNLAGALEKLANVITTLQKTDDENDVKVLMNDAAKEYAE